MTETHYSLPFPTLHRKTHCPRAHGDSTTSTSGGILIGHGNEDKVEPSYGTVKYSIWEIFQKLIDQNQNAKQQNWFRSKSELPNQIANSWMHSWLTIMYVYRAEIQEQPCGENILKKRETNDKLHLLILLNSSVFLNLGQTVYNHKNSFIKSQDMSHARTEIFNSTEAFTSFFQTLYML